MLKRPVGYLLLLLLLGSILYTTFETAAPMTWGDPDDRFFTANSTGCDGNAPPRANPGDTYTGTEGQAIIFDGTASCDPDGENLTYSWSFGDNTTGTGRQLPHTYSQEGTYCVALTVLDPHGACDRGYVRALIHDTQPLAHFTASSYHGSVPLTVAFTDTSLSHDGIQVWHWDFGDNTTSQESAPRHTYNTTGSYPVALTVTEADQDHHTTDPPIWINVTAPSMTEPTRQPPTLTVIDAASATQPGSPATYTFTITNNDPGAFNTSTFALETQLPANWTATLTPSEVPLTPGSNQTIIFVVTPPSTTSSQRYNLTVTAWNTEAPDVHMTDTLSLLIHDPSMHRVPPSLMLSTALQIGAKGEAVTYLLEVHNNDPPSVNASTFTLTAQIPNEWVGSFNVSSLSLSSNTSTTVAFTLTSPPTASSRDYHFTLHVSNTADPDVTSHVTGVYRIPADSSTSPGDDDASDTTTTPGMDTSPLQNITIQLTPELPTTDDLINFTITTPSGNDTVIRVYVDDTLIHLNVSTGNYTYQAGPFSEGNHTYYLEVEDDEGAIIRDPPNGTKLLSIDPPNIGLPTIPWYLFLLPILALILLNSVSQYLSSRGMKTTPTPPPTPSSSTPSPATTTESTEHDPTSSP